MSWQHALFFYSDSELTSMLIFAAHHGSASSPQRRSDGPIPLRHCSHINCFSPVNPNGLNPGV